MSKLQMVCFLFAALSVCGGVMESAKLMRTWVPRERFVEVKGQVLEVRRHIVSSQGQGARAEAVGRFYEVLFSYSISGRSLTANTASPLCTHCPDDVLRPVLTVADLEQAKGQQVSVYVDRENPARAYLILPSTWELWQQAGFALLWLLIVPAVAVVFAKSLVKN